MVGIQHPTERVRHLLQEQAIQLLQILFYMQSGLHRFTQLLMTKMAQVEHLSELQIHLLLDQHL